MKTRTLHVALPLLLSAALVACGGNDEEEKKDEAAIPVEVGKVTVGPIDAAYRGTATLEAEDEATVMAKTTGVVEQILTEEGSRVATGQVLARLETNRLRLEAARARAEADKAQENYDRNTRIYDKHLQNRNKAMEIYREVTTHETDPRRIQEAQKRIAELSGTK